MEVDVLHVIWEWKWKIEENIENSELKSDLFSSSNKQKPKIWKKSEAQQWQTW